MPGPSVPCLRVPRRSVAAARRPVALPSRRRRLSATAAGLLAVAGGLVAGCGSSGPLTVGLDQNGQSITVARGQRVMVTLDGSNWIFDLRPPFGPLTELSTHFTSSRTSSSSTAVFSAGAKGTATVGAKRTSCGSRPCGHGQGQFSVRVVVSG
jgi:hypothetical protein